MSRKRTKRTAPRRAARGRLTRRAFLLGAGAAAGAGLVWASRSQSKAQPTAPQQPAPGEYRAAWISYIELQGMDYTSADAFRASAEAMMDHCAALGLNTVIVQVRPFGDALYPSALFPWSHLCTGVQGQDPGFDPLDTLIAEAHSCGLSLEGWINPYRLRGSASQPAQLCPASLASTHPEWVVTVADGVYLNPAIPEAAAYVVDGVAELVSRYAVDGVHFDDYFYPTTDPSIDAAQFAASGAQDLEAWRRQNVTALVKAAHDAVKAQDPTLRFGVSPQGNPDNDVHQQYSDVYSWLAAEGEDAVVDYLCPQLYWGYGYTLSGGSERFAYPNILAEWLAMPRGSAALYIGLGAYRIGDGDGGANPDSTAQWSTGQALARQVDELRAQGAGGYALYRYGSLFANSAWPQLAQAECQALQAANSAAEVV
ncbi:glycoside hydrolase family 10 protein [Faecalibacterium sp. An121]|uniref:glycoside hydrolase family 10 protein n=1 Tax=Faecalibacterium sp. An121 TaxID=1965550 RepID=UPI000B376BAA|nr:family 10 glycosylhydrolase [Faecalibacterium sp. An121]OUQ37658.1 FenI protein [Faecalibacterium sp. An121]